MNVNIILALACALGAILAYYFRIKKYNRALEQVKFPTTSGQIIQSEIQSQTNTSRNDDGTTDEYITYQPKVKYSYTVNGNNYEGNKIEVLDIQNFNSQKKAEEYISNYTQGTVVNVYYNPENPNESFLDNTIQTKKIDFGTGLLIVILLAGAIYILFSKN